MQNFPENYAEEAPLRSSRFDVAYDPIQGVGACGDRRMISVPAPGASAAYLPRTMLDDPQWRAASASLVAYERLRCRHDFEFWAARCVTIKDKLTGRIVPFVLNHAQRKVLAVLEEDRVAGRPLRIILLKARQWGGSTLIQMYMAWIQTCLRENWHSLICSHIKDTSRSILGMYSAMIEAYPPDLWQGAEGVKPAFRPFERSVNIRELAGRGCRVTVASAESQEALRGSDIAMAHLSETAFWPDTERKSPLDYMRTVCGSVALEPLTLVAIESTANGTGNFFHDEWQRNVTGRGDKRAVFVPWYDIPIYRSAPLTEDRARELWPLLTDYERDLWHTFGLSMEQIAWYHDKAREYATPDRMHAEFPTTPDEAFVNSGASVFPAEAIAGLRRGCRAPVSGIPDGLGRFAASGTLEVWSDREEMGRYIVAVDVGGRTDRADWSVIAVMSAVRAPGLPEVCAQWRGHVDHDILADYAMGIAAWYNRALLVVEANSLESENMENASEGVLARMHREYSNLYCRQSLTADIHAYPAVRPGFHTNRATKAAIIDHLIAVVRHALPHACQSGGGYVERSGAACDELAAYLCMPNGSYCARRSCHDDILMTRALALYVLHNDPSASRPPSITCEDLACLDRHYGF